MPFVNRFSKVTKDRNGVDMYYKYVEIHLSSQLEKRDQQKGGALRFLKDAKESRENNFESSSGGPNQSRDSVPQALWEAHMEAKREWRLFFFACSVSFRV